MELNKEQVEYARKYLECNLRKHYGWHITEEDLQDLISYALRKLILKWEKYYDPKKGTWKTFIVCICKSSLVDCKMQYWRTHQRIAFEQITDATNGIMDREDVDVDDFIDKNFEGLEHDVAMLKWQGCNQREICKKLKLSKNQYVAILAGIHDKLQERIKLK